MKLVFDTEATGLDVDNDKVHCLVAYDLEGGEWYEFTPANLAEIPEFLSQADALICHNLCAYDIPLLQSNFGLRYKGKVYDTLVLSQLLYPDRFGGKHGVEAWGKHFGIEKPSHEDWSVFSEEMLHRCREDVRIQIRIWEALVEEAKGWDWSLASCLSHEMAKVLADCSRAGWKFDKRRAQRYVKYLDREMKRLYNQLEPMLGLYPEKKGTTVEKPWKKDGEFKQNVLDWNMGENVAGPFTKVEWHSLQLTQHEKVAKRLVQLGWEPTEYTPTGVPKIKPNGEPCPNLEKVGDIGPTLARYSKCAHRRNQIQGWIDECREDGRVPAGFAGITNTGRRRHSVIANVPKAEDSVFFGKQMRRLFTCEKGKVLVGCDASGLEMRMLAHYMDDDGFTKELLTGDIHTAMLEASQGLIDTRSTCKNCEYALIYGASDTKIGLTAGYGRSEATKAGEEIRAAWAARFPKLQQLIDNVSRASKRGWLKGLDGRKIWMRRGDNGHVLAHKGLNTLMQGGGAIIMDTATLFQEKWIDRRGFDSRMVSYYHDEYSRETRESQADPVGELMVEAITKAGEYYNLRCPLEGEYKVGKTWEAIHG